LMALASELGRQLARVSDRSIVTGG
jgi:hypothetical protein